MNDTPLFGAWLASRKLVAAAGLFCALSGVLIFWLYGLPGEAIAYLLCLCCIGTSFWAVLSFVRFWRKHKILRKMEEAIFVTAEDLPETTTLIEEDYQHLIQRLVRENRQRQAAADSMLEDLTSYYTLWVHQIKTPIAAMDLLLQEDDSPRRGELEMELLKIGQYVEMVLSYLRLDSDSTDYVLREYPLDDILRQAVRKFAKMFILKKITLDFQETGKTVLTDEKWLLFVVEQVLSNALKYTPEGGTIRIYGDGATVVIADNGIGIREEDQARVFEKGYTGYNGRADKKSTGIGLYLCRQVMDRLNHGISLTSRPGQGTLVRLDLSREWRMVE